MRNRGRKEISMLKLEYGKLRETKAAVKSTTAGSKGRMCVGLGFSDSSSCFLPGQS